jgi:hypothetical protein
MVVCFSCEIVSLEFLNKLAGPPVYYSGSNELSLAPSSSGRTIPLIGSKAALFLPYLRLGVPFGSTFSATAKAAIS